MKVMLNKNDLHVAVMRSQGAITDKALAYIGLKAENQQLQMLIADRVIVIYNVVSCKIDCEGICFVPARLFSDVIKELPEGNVTLELIDSFLSLIAGKSQEFLMKLPIIENKVWQDRPVVECSKYADIAASKLHYIIDQVQFCVSTESPRNFGVVAYLHKPEKDKLRIVGTDGFRLSYAELTGEFSDEFLPSGVCISKRALIEMQKICADGFSHVKVAISDDQTTILASVPNYELYIRLSVVQYPNYLGVLPKNELSSVEVPKSYFQSVAKRVLLAADKTKALQLSFSNDSLTLKARTIGSSEGSESVVIDNYRGPMRELALNGRYLYEVFSTITSNKVNLKFRSEEDPFVVFPQEEPDQCRSLHVLVPIKEIR